jgi:hypothetical protein
LIVTSGPEASLQAVMGVSNFIPVVMIAINFNPLARGYIASLARPGGNITGFIFQQLELAQKQVELLNQAFPDQSRLAMLFDAQSADQFVAAEQTANLLNLQVQSVRLEILPTTSKLQFAEPHPGMRKCFSFCPVPTSYRIDRASSKRRMRTTSLPCSSPSIGEDLIDQLFNSSEKRLARLLLLLVNFGKEGKPEPIVGKFSQETLAEMIGTTRSRVSFFMNKFRKLGFIEYNGQIQVHNSLLNVILYDKPEIRARTTD